MADYRGIKHEFAAIRVIGKRIEEADVLHDHTVL
jgi:hypothetical protein